MLCRILWGAFRELSRNSITKILDKEYYVTLRTCQQNFTAANIKYSNSMLINYAEKRVCLYSACSNYPNYKHRGESPK
jgi:hypothetical protein